MLPKKLGFLVRLLFPKISGSVLFVEQMLLKCLTFKEGIPNDICLKNAFF
jgi:hypothetical protein